LPKVPTDSSVSEARRLRLASVIEYYKRSSDLDYESQLRLLRMIRDESLIHAASGAVTPSQKEVKAWSTHFEWAARMIETITIASVKEEEKGITYVVVTEAEYASMTQELIGAPEA
jgi:hypothetical protein